MRTRDSVHANSLQRESRGLGHGFTYSGGLGTLEAAALEPVVGVGEDLVLKACESAAEVDGVDLGRGALKEGEACHPCE